VGTASVYIHVPFCAALCDYCDFFSVPTPVFAGKAQGADTPGLFVDAAIADLESQLAFFGIRNVPSVYIGGGTPSVLGAARMERLLSGLRDLLSPLDARPGEFTVEANPESLDAAFLRVCLDGGVSRLSLGVQTFHMASRRAIGRAGDPGRLSRGLSLAGEYFPGAFSADLMAGLPFQTRAVLSGDVERLLEFRPAHVSLYGLILEPETILGRRAREAKGVPLPDGDEADGLWIAGRDALEKAGLRQYEVSNFAIPGKECAHNIRYWRMENWLGVGPSASGTLIDEGRAPATGRRFTYPADIDGYLSAPGSPAGREDLSAGDLMRESLLMGFRYQGGPDPHGFARRFGRDIEGLIPGTLTRWRERGFFETEATLAPSREGLLFVNGFLRDAFAEMEAGERAEA